MKTLAFLLVSYTFVFPALASNPRLADATPQLMLEGAGAVSTNGAQRVALPGNILDDKGVELVSPDKQRFRMAVFGLAYVDPVSGKSALIARVRSTPGELASPNRVIYRDAFDGNGVCVDVVYTYTDGSFEQDLVLRKRPPSPAVCGMPETSCIAVLTEFLEAPTPRKVTGVLELDGPAVSGRNPSMSLQDQTLFFGALQIGKGKAFYLGEKSRGLPIAKKWEVIAGRTFLEEAIPYRLLKAQLERLPVARASAGVAKLPDILTAAREIPRVSPKGAPVRTMSLAKASVEANPGVVLDYLIVNNHLLNVDFSGTGSPNKTGFAAVGQSANDYWNHYRFPWVTFGSLTNLLWSDSAASSVRLTVNNAPGVWGNGVNDTMYNSYIYPWDGGHITVTISNLPPNRYHFYIYGHDPVSTGLYAEGNELYDSGNGIYELKRSGTSLGVKGTTIWGNGWNTTNWENGQQYVIFRDVTVTNQLITIDVQPVRGYAIVAGLQIVPSAAVPAPSQAISNLINVDFGGADGSEVGKAAVGLTSGDFWNGYYFPWQNSGELGNLKNSAQILTGAKLEVHNAEGIWGNGISDPMYNSYIYPWDMGNILLTLTNLPVGNYDFYLYAHGGGPPSDGNGIFQLWAGDRDCGIRGTTVWGTAWNSTNWEEGQQYIVFHDVSVESNQVVTIHSKHEVYDGNLVLNGMQIAFKGSADTDNDGLPDAWEMYWFGNLNQNSTSDYDSDFITDRREYELSLDPTRTDTDGDGIPDGADSQFAWVEDESPAGSYEWADNESWNWTDYWYDGDGWGGNEVLPYSGSYMHVSDLYAGDVHQHYFDRAISVMRVNTGDVLYAYVNLDSTYPPDEIVLQWYVQDANGYPWEHRAYWGANLFNWGGTDGTESLHRVGDLPAAGQWVRLEVPASAVGLEGKVVEGMAYTLYGGRAAWDVAGKAPTDFDKNGLPDAWELQYFGHVGVNLNDDPDHDGLSNWYEYKLGYDPTNATTSGGSVNDGEADFDHDGLGNAAEIRKYKSDPANAFSLSPFVNDSIMKFVGLQQNGITPLHVLLSRAPNAPDVHATIDQGAVPGASYDIYERSSLTGPWRRIFTGSPGQTTFVYPAATGANFFYQVRVAKASDSDGDGLTDGFEAMVTLTTLDSAKTDGDSLPDGWEFQWGLDPKSIAGVDGDSGNPDLDSFLNGGTPPSEFSLGSDPWRNNSASPRPVVTVSSATVDGGDSVATEPSTGPVDTATFIIKRTGGSITQPLNVTYLLGGTAAPVGPGTDYSLSPSAGSYPYTIQIPANQNSVPLVVTPLSDSVHEGAETVMVTIITNALPPNSTSPDAYVVDVHRDHATISIREHYSHTYTTTADFNLGVLQGINGTEIIDQLQLDAAMHPQFPYINVACSDRDTVVRINTDTGEILGEYLTTPEPGRNGTTPSRTTVDQFGNVWLANRDTAFGGTTIDGRPYGSIVRIGMIIGGVRGTKNPDGSFTDDPATLPPNTPPGQYLRPPFVYNTCVDRDGDGYFKTSYGLGNVLPWSNNRGSLMNVDTLGGVATADDEAIQAYVRVDGTQTRSIAVDKFNDVWVGGTGNQKQQKVDGLRAEVILSSVLSPGCGGYGSVIDSQGRLWSAMSSTFNSALLRLTPPSAFTCIDSPSTVLYGIAVDPDQVDPAAGHGVGNFIWDTTGPDTGNAVRWWPNGDSFQVAGSQALFPHGATGAQGLTVDDNGHVWVAHTDKDTSVGELQSSDGTFVGNVGLYLITGNEAFVGDTPTGVSVDSHGRIWSANRLSDNVMQIAPANIHSWSAVASSADGTKLVAVVNGGQIYTSIDGGANWTVRERVRAWSAVASSSDGVNLAATVNGGQIYTSSDSGATWVQRSSPVAAWSAIASSANGVKLVATVNGGQIYTSTDSGASWAAHQSNQSWSSVASSTDGVNLVATVNGGKIFTSSDSGSTWLQRNSPTAAWSAVASSATGAKLVATVNGGKIYTSVDSGVNWTARERTRNWVSVASSSDGITLAASANGGRLYTSVDSGATWAAQERIRPWSAIALGATGQNIVAAVNGGRIYTSADIGNTWTVREISLQWSAVACSSSGLNMVAVVNGGAGEIHTSVDSGTNWIARENSRAWSAVASSANGVKLVATVNGGQIYTSTDSGVNWAPQNSPRAWSSVASSVDGVKLVATVNNGFIYTSTDSGVNWAQRESSRAWSGVASSDNGTKLVAVVNGGQIYTSINSGGGWTPRAGSFGNLAWTAVASSSDGSVLLASVDNGQLYVSTDSGVTWNPTASALHWSAVTVSSDGSYMAAVAHGDKIYVSSNYGVDWAPRENDRNWSGITMSDTAERMVATVSGGLIYTSPDFGSTWRLRGGGPADVNRVVDLGDNTHPSGIAAGPYNYSDMTGFNNHIVNPSGCPLKGYWTVIDDAGSRMIWEKVSWHQDISAGGSIEVYVRANDDRSRLSNVPFTPVVSDADISTSGIKGRYLEIRVALTRGDCNGNPILQDLTVNGLSSPLNLLAPLQDKVANEGEDALLEVSATGAGLIYQWSFEGQVISTGTDPFLILPTVDCRDQGVYSVQITDSTGDVVSGGTGFLAVLRQPISIGSVGPASPYPSTVSVSGISLPASTSVASVTVTITGVTHSRPNDLDILLVSPYGTNIWLMSDAGNATPIENATLIFSTSATVTPPLEGTAPITTIPNAILTFEASNYGTPVETGLPGVTPGSPWAFSTSLSDLIGHHQGGAVRNPNGLWKLYIYDDTDGGVGFVQASWCIDFTVQ
jgi:hypothetical protein